MMPIDAYWSFRSPYSYLATPDMLRLQSDFGVQVRLKVVLPLAIRSPEVLFNKANEARVRYIQLDWKRRASYLGMPHGRISPDPIVQNLATLEIASEQPYIYRLSSLGVEAERRGRGVEFAYEVSHLIFGGTENWDQGDHLREATVRAKLDLDELDQAITNGSHLEEIAENQESLEASGHWGVPTFVHEDQPFFGQDRVDTLRWHLTNCGLKR